MIRKSQILLLIGGIILLVQSCTTNTQNDGPVSSVMEKDERMAWWREAKFGLFIHWGVYAVPAGRYGEDTSYGEWIMHNARILPLNIKYMPGQFNPVKYDPAAWVELAKDAGMR